MKTPQRPVWSEGTFLSPQHLQAQDRFHEAVVAERIAALASYGWGVAALELDGAALGAGQLRVDRFEGVLPDGLALAFAGTDAAPPPRSVAEHFPAAARSLDVWLAVARERDGVSAYGEGGEGPRARFAVSTRPVQDATRPGSTAVVAFARPDPVILLGDESREDHEAMKIAELVRTGSGQLAVSDRYVPPLLRIAGAPRLLGGLRDLVARLLAKQRELAEGRRPGEVTAAEVTRLQQLVVLSGAIPGLAHLGDTGDAPPLALYLALVELAGQLAAFAPDADVAGLPKFAHADLRATFEPLLARIVAFVGGLARERFTRVPLEVRGLFQVGRLQDERFVRGAQLFLAVKSDIPEAQVAEQLPRLCKVAAASELQALVQAAAPGVPLQVQHRPPPELPAKPGVVYFALAQGDRLWKGVAQDRTVAIYLPPPFDPSRTTAELLAIPAATA